MEQPLPRDHAKKLLRRIIEVGVITYSRPHALDRLRERSLSIVDCENVLMGGKVEDAEYDNGAWRHHIKTGKIVVVIEFLSEQEVLVVTAWRIGK